LQLSRVPDQFKVLRFASARLFAEGHDRRA
jgi:hypothetical protein